MKDKHKLCLIRNCRWLTRYGKCKEGRTMKKTKNNKLVTMLEGVEGGTKKTARIQ